MNLVILHYKYEYNLKTGIIFSWFNHRINLTDIISIRTCLISLVNG